MLKSTVRSPRAMKSFLTACGLTNALQLVVESERSDEGELRLFNQPFAVIGRDPRADVVLDHPRVCGRHVYIQVVDGEAFWIDLESGTGRDHRDGQKSGWLGGDGIVHAGPYIIRRFLDDNLSDNRRAETKLPRVAPWSPRLMATQLYLRSRSNFLTVHLKPRPGLFAE